MAALQSSSLGLPIPPQLLHYSNGFRSSPFLVDFVGYCKSKRTRRKHFGGALRSTFPHFVSKAVLHLPPPDHSSPSPTSKPQVVGLKEIISERGACGVGFIANLDNKASHDIVKDALTALGCMEHRGGCGADNNSGDGSGLMSSIPWDLFDNWAHKQGIASFDKLHTGVGMVFLPKEANLMKEAEKASAPVAECFALKIGLAAAKRFGYNNFFAEGDSSLIINCIVPVEVPWRLKSLVCEILELSLSFSSISFSHVIREANFLADALDVGVLPVDDSKVTMKGRLGPGMMISVDLLSGQVYENTEVKKRVALSNPYGTWVQENMRTLKAVNFLSSTIADSDAILRRQQMIINCLFLLVLDFKLINGFLLCQAVRAGLLKILSKMGISLLSSYCGAQIFEIYGLGKGVVDLAFCGSISSIGGLTFDELARETLSFWVKAFSEDTAKRLENFGFIQFRPGGEYHGNNPEMSKLLHKAVRQKNESDFSVYQQHLANRPVNVLRDLIEFKSDRAPIPVGKVEPAVSIVQRFCTGGMSLGAISRETHEAIAIAMNRIGGKSNSGEGGEDPIRWKPLADVVDGYSPTLPHLKGLQNGDTATSAIKQVASGRFGVTPTFLVNADQLEIKIAQGAKPGEGGQPPGKKVSAYIARLRNSKPGVPLISPPPHHDIYSIEDLAQLIYDLHQVNPKAKVSVKLVAEAGIGTVASGVAKGNADVIQISGHDGGTGASPISSIKHAGGPWELGLTETHQTLVENGLRERVILRVDGGFKSGVDVLMAATMGADEYGFGSVAMIATGCVMARICHTNNCPVGVASQREELRARFPGVPGDLVNFFLYVAEEVRGMLAQLGYEKLDDIIGRTDLFRPRDISLVKTQHLDLGYILSNVRLPKWTSTMIRNQDVHTNGPVLDDILLADPEISEAIENEKMVQKTIKIYNVDRAVCGRIAGVVAKKYGDTGFAGQLNITFTGSAGQSFGCFLTPGMNIRLVGEANDYVGKSISAGELVVTPAENTGFCPEDATIVGNTCLYGATGGQIFVRGKAGERFAVRNSLAQAVVEGTGDHCCEYMTGGCVVVLGKVGRNVAAGMTGGLAYFLDEDDSFIPKVNREIVKIQRVNAPVGQMQLKSLIEAHVEKTGSGKGSVILTEWDKYLPLFWQLVPPSEEDTPEACADYEKSAADEVTLQSA
ncbi:hypothetical protein ACLB2K_059599 [Fragaria x ananassa]